VLFRGEIHFPKHVELLVQRERCCSPRSTFQFALKSSQLPCIDRHPKKVHGGGRNLLDVCVTNAKDIKNEDDYAHRQTDVINSRFKPVIKTTSQIDRIVIPMGQIERRQNLAPAPLGRQI
jgi:hypothetical protein